ncbi:putative late blight resistance protein homolog R1B-16 [Tanacetum coccineum]
MADALTPLINQLLDHLNDFSTYNPSSVEALDCKRLIAGSFDGLMSHLRKMMLGYENEEAHGLVKIMETVASTNAWYASGKTMMDMVLEIVEELCNIRYVSNVEREEIAVGFDDEVKTLLDQLTGTSAKQLQIISIVGAPGLGKTTLARYLYNDRFIEYTFHIRAWTCVSQVYLKRNLLVDILSSFSAVGTDEIYRLSDELLGEKLYRFLKDRPYLVVLDDIWDSKAWNELKIYFPDDNKGSRVIFISRHKDVRKNVGGAKPAHVLRLRNEDESWEIFQKKVFRTGICPHRLEIIGREIANKCGGLPLAIVIISGLMKNKWLDTWWSQIAESQRSLMVRDPSQYMDSWALSYNLLPRELQHCFLFLGVFPEDYDIPVTKLIWLWVAQGLIHETGSKSLEDVAEDFLMNLIQRSLLTTAKIRADGQIKACRIHDLLRDLCLRKAEEERSSSHRYTYAPAAVPAAALPSHSGFCYPLELGKVLQEGGSMLSETYRTLRILDMESVPVSMFPSDVTDLVNLRYLAIQAHDATINIKPYQPTNADNIVEE